MRFWPSFRPLILQTHRSVLMVEFYEMLSRAAKHDPTLVQTLAALEQDTLRWRWYDRCLLLAPFLIAGYWLWFECVGDAIYGLPSVLLGAALGVGATFSVLLILGSGRVWRDDYLGVMARDLRRAIERGQTLSGAMRERSGWFDAHEIVMVEVGERAGRLPQIFRDLSRLTRTTVALRTHANFLIYPIILCLCIFAIASFLMCYIMPKFSEIYDQMGFVLPKWTLQLSSLYNGLAHVPFMAFLTGVFFFLLFPILLPFSGGRVGSFLIGLWCLLWPLAATVAIAVAVFQALSMSSFGFVVTAIAMVVVSGVALLIGVLLAMGLYLMLGRLMRSGFGLVAFVFRYLPFFNRFVRPPAMARFLTALGALLGARAPLPDSLTLAARASGLPALVRAARRARLRVEQGQSLAAALESEGFIPLRLRRMLDLAERNGTLPEQCGDLAEWCREDVEHWAHRVCAVLEPLTSIVTGSIVLFILLAIYIPIFRLPATVMQKADERPAIETQAPKGP
jgi:type II secretory pathway component PulF